MDSHSDGIARVVEEGQALLELARNESSGRASTMLVHGDRQRAVLIGLTAGSALSEHEAPPAATLQMVLGRARLYVTGGEEGEWLLEQGDLTPIPQSRHAVDALTDCVLLLTISL